MVNYLNLNTHLNKEDTQMANKPMERCSASSVNSGMQIKTTIRYHYTPITVAEIQNIDNTDMLMRMWSNGSSYTLWTEVPSGTANLEDNLPVSCKTKHTLTLLSNNNVFDIYPKELKT